MKATRLGMLNDKDLQEKIRHIYNLATESKLKILGEIIRVKNEIRHN